jgi:predicted nucleic acid-binding protein
MGAKYLIDSNVIIDYLDNKMPLSGMTLLSEVVDSTPNISVISQIEVLRYNISFRASSILSAFINYCTIYPLTNNVVEVTIEICKRHRVKIPDAIIAATAVFNNFTLLTRNINDFKNIEELSYLNPWEL